MKNARDAAWALMLTYLRDTTLGYKKAASLGGSTALKPLRLRELQKLILSPFFTRPFFGQNG